LLLGVFIDVTPSIKFNPIKAIFRYIGKALNADVKTEITSMKTDMGNRIDKLQSEQIAQRDVLNQIISENQSSTVESLKWEIIDFGTSVKNEVKHNRSQYRHVLKSIGEYNELISRLGSGIDESYLQVQESATRIQKHYDKNKESNLDSF
jgi:hypothetical protein